MGTQYAGDGSAYPTSFALPDDGEEVKALVMNVPGEALGDRTEYLRTHSPRLKSSGILTGGGSGTFVVPTRVGKLRVTMAGGGGGGGGGASGRTEGGSVGQGGGGGSAGGGALVAEFILAVTAGETLTHYFGAGGAGGTGGVEIARGTPGVGTAGATGGDTILKRGVTTLAVAYGASPGLAGNLAQLYLTQTQIYTAGGTQHGDVYSTAIDGAPGKGGAGWAFDFRVAQPSTRLQGRGGGQALVRGGAPGTIGGAAIIVGAAAGGGGAGGGGGACNVIGGVAGAGGNGGAGTLTVGYAGTNGGAGSLGCGGGGGGGGGGNGSDPPIVYVAGAGGIGGQGGAGWIEYSWTEDD